MALPKTVIPSRCHRRGISARKNLVPALRSLSSVPVSALPFADAAARVSRVPLARSDKRVACSRRAPFARLSPRHLFLPQRAKRITYPPKPRKTLLRALGESTGAFLPVAAIVKMGRSASAPFSYPCAARPCVPYHPCGRPPTYPPPMPLRRASVHAAPCALHTCPHVRPSPKTHYVNFTLAIFLPPKGGGTRRIGPEGLLTGQKGRGMFGP